MRTSWLSQEDAARLMAAFEAALKATDDWHYAESLRSATNKRTQTRQKFSDLVAALVEPER